MHLSRQKCLEVYFWRQNVIIIVTNLVCGEVALLEYFSDVNANTECNTKRMKHCKLAKRTQHESFSPYFLWNVDLFFISSFRFLQITTKRFFHNSEGSLCPLAMIPVLVIKRSLPENVSRSPCSRLGRYSRVYRSSYFSSYYRHYYSFYSFFVRSSFHRARLTFASTRSEYFPAILHARAPPLLPLYKGVCLWPSLSFLRGKQTEGIRTE